MGVVIGVLLLTTLAMPVISDATTTERTFTNEGYFRAAETSDETVIEWNPSVDPFILTINGDAYSLDSMKQFGNYSIAFSDDFILRYYYNGASSQNLQIWNSAYAVGANNTIAYKAIVTINENEVTWATDAGSSPTTVTHSGSYFVMDSEGDYIMKYSNKDAYVNPSSTIVYAGGISNVGSGTAFTSIYFEGTVDDLTVTPMRNNTTVTDIESTTVDVDGYLDLAQLSKVTFTTTATITDVEYTVDQTYTYFLVPYQVTAELVEHLDSSTIQLLSIIPLLITVGIIMAVVGLFVMRRE